MTIQTARYGTGGPNISRLGFGVMRLPTTRVKDTERVDFGRSTPLLRAAMAAGVNLFDSHHQYHGGDSEVAIGKALAGWDGPPVAIQTKTPWYSDEPTEYFERLLYEALEKLGVNAIDYLLHHSMTMDMWKRRGRQFIRFTDWAMSRGLIRHRGFSSHDTPASIRAFIDTGEFTCMLVSYSWMHPQVRDVIAYAADRGMGVTVMNPLCGGLLATGTPEIMRLLPGAKTAAEIGFRYVLATPGVTCALSGMNAEAQLGENIAVASRRTPLTERQQQGLQERLARIEKASRRFCTACGYCMPCEHGVDIPANFRLLNQTRFFGRRKWAHAEYARLREHDDGDRSAAACTQCGLCEPKCPNDVPIRKQLETVHTALA